MGAIYNRLSCTYVWMTKTFGELCHLLFVLILLSGIDLRGVLRQFGMQQGIPSSCSVDMDLHSMDRRRRHQYDWIAFHTQYISLCASRSERIVPAPLATTLWILTVHICNGIKVSHNALSHLFCIEII